MTEIKIDRETLPNDGQKAVVGMDGTMSAVGDSNGRSGKSLLGVALSHLEVP